MKSFVAIDIETKGNYLNLLGIIIWIVQIKSLFLLLIVNGKGKK